MNLYELASMCAIAGVTPRAVPAPSGFLTWELIEPAIREKIYYDSQTALITLENTHNMHGGRFIRREWRKMCATKRTRLD